MRVSSNNPQFSYIISKNPSSPMSIKSLRKGHLVGGFDERGAYVSTFIDKEGPDSSFGEDEYLSSGQYNDPSVLLNILSEHYRSCINNKHPEDSSELLATVDIPILPMSSNDVTFLRNCRKPHWLSFIPVQIGDTNYYSVIITVEKGPSDKGSLYLALHFIQSILFYSLIKRDVYINTSQEALLEKYMNSISISGLPYKWISTIKNKLLTNGAKFEKWKGYLEQGYNVWSEESAQLSLVRGDTLAVRKRWVEKNMREDLPLVDIGCNTGNYLYLSKRVPSYIPIDTDERCRERCNLKIEEKGYDNASLCYASFDDWMQDRDSDKRYQYLITEVLEHMPIEKSIQLVEDVLTRGNADLVLITVPNYDFNYYYAGEASENPQYRHEDHHWEATADEIGKIMNIGGDGLKDCYGREIKLSSSFHTIGDAITSDGSNRRPTCAFVIERL